VPTPSHILEAEAIRRHYTRLLEDHRIVKEKLARAEIDAERYKAGYDFYMMIQKACQESPVVAGEFQRFLMTCRLVEESEEGTPGLTTEDNSQYAIRYP
jgi:hypothetical protein